MILKFLYFVCIPNSNIKHPATSFLEKDEIVFHLAAMSQCAEGGEGHICDSAYAFQLKSTASDG
jgi:hypothetical protein